MVVHSILFPGGEGIPVGVGDRPQPAFFADLNLDQIVASVTGKDDEYSLAPLFYSPLSEIDAVRYRQEVFQDLERDEVHDLVAAFGSRRLVAQFTHRSREMRGEHHDFGHFHRACWLLEAVECYCQAVTALAGDLAEVRVRSRGLLGLQRYLDGYLSSKAFTDMRDESRRLEEALGAVDYCILVKGDRVTVGRYDDQVDYSEQVTATFERFQQDATSGVSLFSMAPLGGWCPSCPSSTQLWRARRAGRRGFSVGAAARMTLA